MIQKKTKVVATIGPASQDPATLEKMIKAGMNVARLNFSHGTYESFEQIIKTIRTVSNKLRIPVAIMQDLQGPKIRVGEMPKTGVTLKNGSQITLTTKDIVGTETLIPVQYKHLAKDVKPHDKILMCDGMLELSVIKVHGTDIDCKVVIGGLLESHKGINVPTASISANPITPKDLEDLKFGLSQDVDFVALSFEKSAVNIKELKDLIKKHWPHARTKHAKAHAHHGIHAHDWGNPKGTYPKIVAKIERHEAITNLESIIEATDVVMVARGDLGVEISPEQVPLFQKEIIHLANLHGKPVITATEMLLSMVNSPRASRAEISDAANAVFDHTDALMLSNESAVGKYPVKAVETLSKVAASIEHELKKHQHFLPNNLYKDNVPTSYATCAAAAELAKNMQVKLIVALTGSGFTAQHIAKHRIYIPIVAITEDPKVQKQLQMTWGLSRVFVRKLDMRNYLTQVRQLLIDKKLVEKKDKVVIVTNASKEEKLISTITI